MPYAPRATMNPPPLRPSLARPAAPQVHADGEDNFLCLFSGQKRLALWPPSLGPLIRSAAAGWRESTDSDASYGGFAGPPDLDVTDVNISRRALAFSRPIPKDRPLP
jgi:hypothetical protein